jgi:hypothetical protein
MRRLRGLAAVDPEIRQGIRARDERRRHGLRLITGDLTERYGRPESRKQSEVVDVLHMLSSFESFDALMQGD